MRCSTHYTRLLLVVCMGLALALAPHAAQAQATRTVSETVNLDRDGRVQLSTFTGAVDVTTWDRAAVQIDVRIEGDEQEHVDATRIRIDGSGRAVEIETDYDALENRFLGFINLGNNNDRPAAYYTIRMPATADLSIEDFSSELTVDGLRGDLSLETFSSPVTLRDIEGRIRAETYSSDVEAHDVAGGIHFETFSGNATITLRALADDYRFEGFSGDVELRLPADAGFELDAELGMSGDLVSDFSFDAANGEDNARGTVNGGGPRIRFETFSGDLTLRAQ